MAHLRSTRFLRLGGIAAMFMGVGMFIPVVSSRLEADPWSVAATVVTAIGCILLVGGSVIAIAGFRFPSSAEVPSGVRAVVMANIIFLAFFAMELSDRLVQQGGKVFYWTTFLLPPTLILFYGLLAARKWAWWSWRIIAALGFLWFLGFAAMIPFANLHGSGGVPVPFEGRLYMIGVSLVFAAILGCVSAALGKAETQRYFHAVE